MVDIAVDIVDIVVVIVVSLEGLPIEFNHFVQLAQSCKRRKMFFDVHIEVDIAVVIIIRIITVVAIYQ